MTEFSSRALIALDMVGNTPHQLVKMEYGVDGTATMVSADNPMPVTATGSNFISVLNSTATPLNSLAVFTGTAEDVSAYDSAVIAVKADQDGTYSI